MRGLFLGGVAVVVPYIPKQNERNTYKITAGSLARKTWKNKTKIQKNAEMKTMKVVCAGRLASAQLLIHPHPQNIKTLQN